jgi:hypothetical protein
MRKSLLLSDLHSQVSHCVGTFHPNLRFNDLTCSYRNPVVTSTGAAIVHFQPFDGSRVSPRSAGYTLTL